jgi:hypothetical protein
MPERDNDPTFPEEHESGTLVGVEARGSPIYYDEEANSAFEARVDEGGTLQPGRENERTVEGGAVDNLIDDVRERSGWDSLADYAKEHLPGVSDTDDTSGER